MCVWSLLRHRSSLLQLTKTGKNTNFLSIILTAFGLVNKKLNLRNASLFSQLLIILLPSNHYYKMQHGFFLVSSSCTPPWGLLL